MSVQSTNSQAGQAAAIDSVAKPLAQLTKAQREKVSSELLRIHDIVSKAETRQVSHKDKCGDKAERACTIDFKPERP